MPVHTLEESKAQRDGYMAVMHYGFFVAAIILHERLLPR